MFTLPWITEKELERVIENKGDEFRRKKNMEIQSGGEKMRFNSYGNLGIAYDSLGQVQQAIEYHKQSLSIAIKVGDRAGQAR